MLKAIYGRIKEFITQTKPLMLWAVSLLTFLISLLGFILGGAVPLIGVVICALVSVAFLRACHRAINGETVKEDDLFCYFTKRKAPRILKGLFWKYLYILLWSLIPVVGLFIAVVRSYEYNQVALILANEPDVAPRASLDVSKERTQGHKWDMFLCDITWVAVVMLVVMVLGVIGQVPIIGSVFSAFAVVVYILFLAVSFLISGLLQACYYDYLLADASGLLEVFEAISDETGDAVASEDGEQPAEVEKDAEASVQDKP